MAAASLVVLVATPSPAQETADPCSASPYRAVGGALKCVPHVGLTLEDLAAHLAPVLWFGEHEPLRLGLRQLDVGADPPIPTALPEGHEWRTQATVYWRATRAILAMRDHTDEGRREQLRSRFANLAGSDHLVSADMVLALRRLNLTIRYFFYYPREITHSHDLESAEVEVSIEYGTLDTTAGLQPCPHVGEKQCWGKPDGATWLRIQRVTGAAHGLGYYSNTFRPTEMRWPRGARDMSDSEALRADRWSIAKGVDNWIAIPLSVLVEEGKHASAPDSDADGEYVPGVDVNEYVGDSWGIRDSFGRKFLGGARFGSEMTMRRTEKSRVGPQWRAADVSGGYVLAPTNSTEVCQPGWRNTYERSRLLWSPELKRELSSLVEKMGFCGDVDVLIGWDAMRFVRSWPRPYGDYWELFTIAYRYDSRFVGDASGRHHNWVFTIVPTRVKYLQHYVSLRAQMGLRTLPFNAFDVVWSPSASRLADPYVAVGGEAQHGSRDTERMKRLAWAIEGGFKLRIPWESAPLPLVRLLGIRVGARLSSPLRPSIGERVRLVFEVGGGAF